jgi:NAD(P)-dependent dehydrogenase (short-subunit alcohol dehydrogenase family)
MPAVELPPESRGEAPGRGRMVGRRVVVVGAGQTDFDLDDQPIGNGRAIAVLLAREGAEVVAVDVDETAAAGTVEMIRVEGGVAYPFVADVADPRAVEDMVAAAHRQLGGLDALAYNVGVPGPDGLDASTPEAWDATFAVNLRGAMLTARAALPVMDPGSALVFTSSIGALRGTGRIVAYEASKAGLAALMRAVAGARRTDAVRANLVMPGLIDTGLGRNAARADPGRAAVPIPLGRQGTAWEVAYAALFLLSRESAYVTGQTLVVDGGRTTI